MPKKSKKNPADPLTITRAMVEPAIGGTLTPKTPRKKKPAHKKRRQR